MARNLVGDAVGPGPDRRARQLALLIVGGLVLALVVLGVVAWRAVRPGDPDLPSAQRDLVDAVQRAQQHGTGTPVAQVQARRDRRTELCGDGPGSGATRAGRLVEGWVGTIQDIDTPLGGDDGTFRIDLGQHLSLVQDTDTPGGGVRPGGRLYRALSELDDGDRVRFGGSLFADREDCFAERSTRLRSSLLTPTFELRLTAISPD